MKERDLEAIRMAISGQVRNDYPKILIQDTYSGNVFSFGTNCHDRLIISEDGRSLHYYNLQNGDGSSCGDYRFYYEKPKIETEEDKRNAYDIDFYARSIENLPLFTTENPKAIDCLEDVKKYACLKICFTSLKAQNDFYDFIDQKISELKGE